MAETVTIFGNPNDPEVKRSINKVAITGRKTEIKSRPSFDSGTGPCGKHMCSCQSICMDNFYTLEKKFS